MQNNHNFGCALIEAHQELEVRLLHADCEDIINLIKACIELGWTTEPAILAKIHQIGGPYYDQQVRELLTVHASPIARPQQWECDSSGHFRLVQSAQNLAEMSFWRPVKHSGHDDGNAA